ncbi:PIN domain-containing protein [Vibrio metschnikovii]|uniref:PIN domain-containing protein n=1 Tax=Vibrio metschnikovii TaxID=28172 RepID=UPI001C2FD57C|nr:PIN domain-containing protein [Vibrio metschnikovii]
MKVFLDTNVFYKNWYADKPNFKLLFYFLNNQKFDLLLSDLVVQETNNIRNREVNEVRAEITRLLNKGSKLNENPLSFKAEQLDFNEYELSDVLKYKVDWIENISYENISQKVVVERAIRSIKPFTNQEKGYRDTLIWLSFLAYLQENDIEGDVAFITNNKHDFFESKGNTLTFNEDLQKDIDERSLKANIIPYLNIFDFVNEKVDKIEHSFDRQEILDDLEEFLIEETESYLNSMSNYDIGDILNARVFSEKITSVMDIESDIFEGLEDPEVKSVKRLPENSVYISAYFEMRRVDLVITIDAIEFKQYVEEIEAIKSLYNIELDGEHVKLSFILRTCVDGSFEYDAKEKEPSNLSVEYIFNRMSRRES